jgi:hypothetical protein
MARLVEVTNIPEDIMMQEGFGRSSEGMAVAPEVVVKFPRLTEAEMPEEDLLPAEFGNAPSVPYSGGAEGARAALQGLTMGFGDEIEAGVRAPFSEEDYTEIRNRLRAQQEQFGEDYPKTQMALDVAGGLVVPAFGVAGGAIKAGKGLLGATKAGAGAGAVAGAVTGAGVAPEISDIPEYATKYGIGGGAVGAAAPAVIKLGGRTVGGIVDALGFSNANKVASKKLASYLEKENLTPQQAQDMLAEYRRLGVPDPVIADLGENLRGAGYASYIVPNKAKTKTADFLENRQQELANSLVKGLEEKSGVQSQGRFGFDYIDDLAKSQDAAARKAYPKAYEKDIPATPFRKYADRDVFAKAYEEAVKRADVYGQKLPTLEQIRNSQYISTQILHEIKKGLDDVIEKETDKVTGKMSGYGADVSKIKREFNDLIKYYNKDYAQANAKFADMAKLKESYSNGLDYMKMETAELASKLKKMTPAEKESFRVGMISEVKNKIANFKGGDPSRLVFKSDRQKESLKYAFESEGQYKDFVRQVEAQNQLLRTYRKVRGGSETQERATLSEDIGLARDLMTGNIAGAGMNIARQGAARAGGMRPDVAEIMQNRLFATDPAEQARYLRMMQGQSRDSVMSNPLFYGSLLGETMPLAQQ